MSKKGQWVLVTVMLALLMVVANFFPSRSTYIHSQASAITWDGRWAYVADFRRHIVSVVETASGRIVTTIPVGRGPSAITIMPDGRSVQVYNSRSRTICVIDIATNRILSTDRAWR